MTIRAKQTPALWHLVVLSLALYGLLPFIVSGISQSEPSFSERVFGEAAIPQPGSGIGFAGHAEHLKASVWFTGACAALFGFYFWALRIAKERNDESSLRTVFLGGVAFFSVQLLSSVMLSTDVFAYAMYGRVISLYHANPYDLAPPIAGDDPFLKLFAQEYLPSWYGPLWTIISAAITKITGAQVGLTVFAFRLTSTSAAMVCGGIIASILRRHAPERATQGMVFFLWNPLLVLETGLSCHNDAVMLMFVLLAVWLHLRGWKACAVVALTLSALVKFLTGMLIPLYVLLVLRQMGSGASVAQSPIEMLRTLFTVNLREKSSFIVRAGIAAGAICFVANTATRPNSDTGAPVSSQAIASDFYANNFHELIFKGLRRTLCEDADMVRSPIYFQGWWIETRGESPVFEQPNSTSQQITVMKPGVRVVVIAPQTSDEWARIYDPASRKRGFVRATEFTDSTRPDNADELANLFDMMTAERPTVVLANNMLRLVLWLGFAAFGLLCAWKTASLEEFFVWSAAALLASYFLIITEIWPWYANWALALGALATTRKPAWLAAVLSASVLTLYVTIGFQGSENEWVYTFRSIPAFVVPLVLFGIKLGLDRKASLA